MNAPNVFTHSPADRRGVFCFSVFQFLAILNKGTVGNVLGYLVVPLWVTRKVRVWNLWTRVSTSSLKDKQMYIPFSAAIPTVEINEVLGVAQR